MIPIVLASASPRRKALLHALGLEVTVQESGAAERLADTPESTVLNNARSKCDAVVGALQNDALVIAADTVVVLENEILGKPADYPEAKKTLARLSGRTHAVYTGVAVHDTHTGRSADGFEVTEVTFRSLSAGEIDRFVEAVKPLDRAGAYTSDGPGSLLIDSYRGCYHNVLGLPIVKLDLLLREIGDNLFMRMDPARARFL